MQTKALAIYSEYRHAIISNNRNYFQKNVKVCKEEPALAKVIKQHRHSKRRPMAHLDKRRRAIESERFRSASETAATIDDREAVFNAELVRAANQMRCRNEIMEALATQSFEMALMTSLEKLLVMINLEKGAIVTFKGDEPRQVALVQLEEDQLVRAVEEPHGVVRRARIMRKSVQLPLETEENLFETAVPIQAPSTDDVVGMIYLLHAEALEVDQFGDILDLSRKLGMTLERHLLFDQMQHEKIKIYQLLDSIRESVLYIESSGENVYANEALLKMFPPILLSSAQGFRHAYERATSLFEHIDQPEELHDYIGRLMNGELPGETIELTAFRGNLVLRVYAERIAIQNVEWGMMLVLRDVTKEKELDRKQSEFVSIVSHELRTPLSSIMGFTELLLKREIDPERTRKYLSTIHAETVRLSQLINDILDIQRHETSDYQDVATEVDMKQTVAEVETLFTLSSELHTITFDVPSSPCTIIAHEEKMRQLLNNLIMNAIKYSPDGGTVKVSIDRLDDSIELKVSDEGIGISEKSIPYIFDKFYRADNSDTRKIGGTGLGLAICKMIVEEHEGSITVDSRIGKGTTFTVLLPLAPKGKA